MTREQLIEIAKAGFVSYLQDKYDLDNAQMVSMNDIFWLIPHPPTSGFALPETYFLAVEMFEKRWVQFNATKPFNHLAAIRKMEQLGLV